MKILICMVYSFMTMTLLFGQAKWKKIEYNKSTTVNKKKSRNTYQLINMHQATELVEKYKSLDTFYNKPSGFNLSIKNTLNKYNSSNLLEESINKDTTMDEIGIQNVYSSKYLNYYDSKKNEKATFYLRDNNGGTNFELISKDSSFYNLQNKITDKISYKKDADSIEYISYYSKYKYDTNNCLNYEETTYLDDTGNIQSSRKDTFNNDASCNLTYRKLENYDSFKSKYETKVEYFTKITYDNNFTEFFTFIKKNYIESGICQYPDSFIVRIDKKGRRIKEWQWCANHVQFQYEFDIEDRMASKGFKVLDSSTKEWSGYIEYYLYDSKGNFSKTIWMPQSKLGNPDSSKLKIYINTFKYDDKDLILQENYTIKLENHVELEYIDIKYLERYCENSPKKIRVETDDNFNGDLYNSIENYKYEYFDLPCSTAEENISIEKIQVALYPNPAQEEVNIDLFGYVNRYRSGVWELYDIQGQRVVFYPVFENKSEYRYDISQLSNGMYFWRMVFDGKIGQSGKLVILK